MDLTGVAALRSVLRIRPFRRLWLVLSVASFGDWIGILATALFASQQVSGSVAQGSAFSSTIAIRLLPALILGPIAGVMADRFDRRYTMVICDILRFFVYGSIPVVALISNSGGLTVTWTVIATFIGETITLMWIPAKEAAVPNLIPKGRLEASNQLSLITTYGVTPILAALVLAALDGVVRGPVGGLPTWASPVQIALYINALSRAATAAVVFFGIKEISAGRRERQEKNAEQSMFRQFVEGWRYIGGTPFVRGLVLGIFGAFAGAGIVVGTARFFTASLGAGDAAFYLLFATLFIGLAVGIGAGPAIVKELSRRRWFGVSLVLASGAVAFLSVAFHLSMALFGALFVGAGAGMAFLAGVTLLGGQVNDEVRGRVFAVVQIGARLVLLLAISLAGLLVGLGSSRTVHLGGLHFAISSTRVLLLVAGLGGIWSGVTAFRQMDDKHGVPVLADLWGAIRGRPLSPAEPFSRTGIFVVFEGGEGAGKSTQVTRLSEALAATGADVVVTREPGATDVGARIRSLVLSHGSPTDAPSPRAEALLYAADRAHHVATVVRPALARGAVVISDRYVDSSLAYQGAGRTLPVQEISWLSSWATGGLKPDLVVLLDVDPAVGLSRVDSRGAGPDRLESESRAFHERVRYAFLDLASADPKRYLVLDAARPAEEIAAVVSTRVNALLADGDDLHGAPDSTDAPPGVDLTAPDLMDRTVVVRPGATPDETSVIYPAGAPVAQRTQVIPPSSPPGISPPGVSPPGASPPGASPPGASPPGASPVEAERTQVVPESERTQILSEADLTQTLPSADPTQVIVPAPDPTQPLPRQAGEDGDDVVGERR
ncbi:dTMP kinase [Actinoplanes sp. N902-109]|uniref:dTMP kinase n=1 Tax=Actinoplanes sp. (strain N902-109) TaxID=649831 RepID=UPI0003295392|nr:dTMP kinase [Actinoplanes sp. N902-109]AGL13980.1 thymidylate kinase [Actinoplanes sp. N902-109]